MTSNGNGKINQDMFIGLYTTELFLNDLRKQNKTKNLLTINSTT